MRLERNNGKVKYIVINAQKFPEPPQTVDELVQAIKAYPESVEFNEVGSENESFVIKLKDENADSALVAYASAASHKDPEYACDVAELAMRSGQYHPFCKTPD